MTRLSLALAGLVATGIAVGADRALAASAEMNSPEGKALGTIQLSQTPHGVLIDADLKNLPAGGHGFHIHEKGGCSPNFKAAGGHYNPNGKAHGLKNAGGHHAGDMPNIFVPAGGALKVQVLNAAVTTGEGKNSLFDGDGSAFIIHAKPDTHGKAAGAGGRIACGAIKK